MSEVLYKILYAVVLLAIIVISSIINYTDFKKREISNWLNLSLLIVGIGNLFVQMIGTGTNGHWNLGALWTGLIAMGGFMLIGVIMFTFNHDAFGGGDVKLVAASGLLLTKMQDILIYAVALLVFSIIVFIIAKIQKQRSVAGGPSLCLALITAMSISAPGIYIGIPTIVLGLASAVIIFLILKSKGLLYKGEE